MADGWLPSMSYLQSGDLAAGNAVIDEAADRAGRSPSAVRRLLNINGQFTTSGGAPLVGPPAQWAEELTALTLTEGISAFILAGDDPDDIRRFAAEVARAVRELVAAERAVGPTSSSPPTPAGSPGRVTDQPSLAARAVPQAPWSVVPIPDDGRRRSDVRLWDEGTRPTGPAPERGRTYTTEEQANGQQLIDVHDALRSELTQLYDLVDQVAAGLVNAEAARSAINEMTMRQNKWTVGTYCESYCRIVTTHHSLEDGAMFPALKRADPRLGAVVERLEQEHRVIHDVLDGVDRALVAFVSVPGGVDELRAAVDVLSDTLLSHLAYEERELVEPLSRITLY